MRRLLFTRHFQSYTGGHGKVLDYMGHADAHPDWSAHVWVDPRSAMDGNPFLGHPRARIGSPLPESADVLFLGGEDWQRMPPVDPERVVINLIQGVRHAEPGSSLRRHLRRKAIRICVSHPVADAIRATGEVRGSVHVIPAGLELPKRLPRPSESRRGIFIAAHKQPRLGQELAASLEAQGHHVDLQLQLVARDEFLSRLESAEIAIPLPLAEEGFFLPGLEAMALGCLVIGVDAIGNREYLRPWINAIPAQPTLEGIIAAVSQVPPPGTGREAMLAAGLETAARFSLAPERASFHRLLDDLEAQWRAT